jgi:hypothetical protein
MFSFVIKFIVLPVLIIVVVAIGVASYLLLTPITESNVKSRIWNACMLSSGLKVVDNWQRASPRQVNTPAQCDCVSNTVLSTMTLSVAVTGSEAVRSFMEDGARTWFFGNNRSAQGQPQPQRYQIADAFIRSATRISRPCSEQERR